MVHFPLTVEDLPLPPAGRTGFPWTEGTPALSKTLPDGVAYPKISVITPSYQQGQYLEETIRSVLLQGYPDLEYIVIDGGSQDGSVEIIQKYAPFLSFWTSERDSGQASAINKGFARSSGAIMGWLNSDDILLPGALYQIAHTFAAKPQAQLVTGLRKRIDSASRVTGNTIYDPPSNYYLRHYCCIAQETTYWRRPVWEQLGTLDESFQFALDYEYWLRAIREGYRFHFMPHYTGGFRDYPDNKSNSWLDVYNHDLAVLYQRYELGADEADIHAKLGRRWARRYGFYVAMGRRSWTNDPRLVQLAWRVLEVPILSDVLLAGWEFRQRSREFRQIYHQSKARALRSALTLAKRALFQPKFAAPQRGAGGDDVRLLTDGGALDDDALSQLPADTLVFGKNWYPTEFYGGEYFRWCSDGAELIIANASKNKAELWLVVSPALRSKAYHLDVTDEQETVLASVKADQPRLEFRVTLPAVESPHLRLQLRWNGLTYRETHHGERRLAFRIMALGWHNSSDTLDAD